METYEPHNIWLLRSYINNREDIDENVPRPAVSGLTGPELHVYINHTEPTDTVNDKHGTNLLSAEKPKIPRLWTPFCVDFRIQICNFVSTACVKALSATSREREEAIETRQTYSWRALAPPSDLEQNYTKHLASIRMIFLFSFLNDFITWPFRNLSNAIILKGCAA